MKTLLVFLLVVITVSLSYAHNEEALKSSRIAAKLREKRQYKEKITGQKNFLSLRDKLTKHFSNIADKMKAKAQDLHKGDIMAKRSTNKIREVLTDKLQKLKKLKEN